MAAVLGPKAVQHGTQIFAYCNLRTNQVVYSLTRSMNNTASLKQLPYLGKKTVPAALRKDLWQPLCLVEFPQSYFGLSAYRKLREYRRLHELAYPISLVTETEGKHKGQLVSKKQKGKVLMNQKANSVADIAAVLLQQEALHKEELQDEELRQRRLERRKQKQEKRERAQRELDGLSSEGPSVTNATEPVSTRTTTGTGSEGSNVEGSKEIADSKEGVNGAALIKTPRIRTATGPDPDLNGTKIRWINILDAEYAETWPKAVVHVGLGKSRYTAAWPAPELPIEVEDMEDGPAEGSETAAVEDERLPTDSITHRETEAPRQTARAT